MRTALQHKFKQMRDQHERQSVPVALHEQVIRDHVAATLATLDQRMREHETSLCGGSTACKFCQLWAVSFASIRRVLDFLEVEMPHR